MWGDLLHPSVCPQVGNLKAHLKIHIADGPLKCRECGKQFTTSGSAGVVGDRGQGLLWGWQGPLRREFGIRGRISTGTQGFKPQIVVPRSRCVNSPPLRGWAGVPHGIAPRGAPGRSP